MKQYLMYESYSDTIRQMPENYMLAFKNSVGMWIYDADAAANHEFKMVVKNFLQNPSNQILTGNQFLRTLENYNIIKTNETMLFEHKKNLEMWTIEKPYTDESEDTPIERKAKIYVEINFDDNKYQVLNHKTCKDFIFSNRKSEDSNMNIAVTELIAEAIKFAQVRLADNKLTSDTKENV